MAPVTDIVLLQDLSGSYSDDLPRLKTIISPLIDDLTNPTLEVLFGNDPNLGIASFVDKPVGKLGSTGDFVYQKEVALTSNKQSIVDTVNGLRLFNGGDGPESQLEALLQVAQDDSLNYRAGSNRIALISTDAAYHTPPDGVEASATITRPNDGDNVPEADEDYPTIAQVKSTLEARNITPVFLVTADVEEIYEKLVNDLGRGEVVTIDKSSSNIADATFFALGKVRDIISKDPLTGEDVGTGTADAEVIDLTIKKYEGVDLVVFARDGDDTVRTSSGNDVIFAGPGRDLARSGGGRDFVSGDEGDDLLVGGSGDDTLVGGGDNDTLDGGLGNDLLDGRSGDDELRGGSGNDIIRGGSGNELMSGDAGNDSLTGGAGIDSLTGGRGMDSFVFNASSEGVDDITDFSVVDDTINASAAGFGGGLTVGAAITADQFTLGSEAGDSTDRFIYESSTGGLFFDVDGLGGNGQLQLATLSSGLALTNNDIFIVA